MESHTITAMFESRADADRAARSVREDTNLAGLTVRVLPETDTITDGVTTTHREETGFLAALRHFFMPEEDRYVYAEGMRRGSYMVAVDADEIQTHRVMDLLEQAGAVDLDTQEAQWRQEGWRGYEPSTSATTSAAGLTTPPTGYGESSTSTAAYGTTGTSSPATGGTTPSGFANLAAPPASGGVGAPGASSVGTEVTGTANTEVAGTESPRAAKTEERIPLAEETLRVGKRLVTEGRVRIRTYVVETPVSETVHLRDEHVEVERRPADRPATDSADLFRERTLEAAETREEPVVSKDARVREELVMRRSANERDETVKDTVRRTEVNEDRGDKAEVARDRAVAGER
jgi:uncharacterized protein (TIGR02271 family)